ncbi:hypothetical protein QYH69_27840 [Paraburkholderia sp. SARCC-3016]|uniref:hypothetical protein n=1 Tax=Paraburkholderia sp. SARCC-3016 TaxID=3058611 RepID=UPI002807E57B|nr:hypothetical protein [Paraburkholderia sp. SARCC-3016]MDQ7981053.1 hypothetical protein [Paraburkholderia sp. SARCC-3016]
MATRTADRATDPGIARTAVPASTRCFSARIRRLPAAQAVLPMAPHLDDDTAQALADVLPLLGCAEEAATLAFGRLADRAPSSDEHGIEAAALRAIEAEERVHDELLQRLGAALPAAPGGAAQRAAARRFHLGLETRERTTHLARICAVDAAVCTILSRLTAPRGALAQDPQLVRLLQGIRRDEARHVAVTRKLVAARGAAALGRMQGAAARHALAGLLVPSGAAFERLCVDPDALLRDVAHLPNGLF